MNQWPRKPRNRAATGLSKLPVVADAGHGDATRFRLGLTQRGLPYGHFALNLCQPDLDAGQAIAVWQASYE